MTAQGPLTANITRRAAQYLTALPPGPVPSASGQGPRARLEMVTTATRRHLNRFVFDGLWLSPGSRFPVEVQDWEQALKVTCDRSPIFAEELSSILDLLQAAEQAPGDWEDLLDRARLVLGVDHPAALGIAEHRALIQLRSGQVTEAIDLLEKTLLASGSAAGAGDPRTLVFALSLAGAYSRAGRIELADEFYAAVHFEAMAALGARHELTRTAWARLRTHRKDHQESGTTWREDPR